MVGVYSETSCFLPIKGAGGLLQHNPPTPPPLLCNLSSLFLSSSAMFAPSAIFHHLHISMHICSVCFFPASSDILPRVPAVSSNVLKDIEELFKSKPLFKFIWAKKELCLYATKHLSIKAFGMEKCFYLPSLRTILNVP